MMIREVIRSVDASAMRAALRGISVEPTLLLYQLAASSSSIAVTNLYLQKSCSPGRPLALGDQCAFDEASQRVVTAINSWRPLCESILPVAIILLGGVWSDSRGKRRRPLMYLPILGEVLGLLIVTASVFFWEWSAEGTALAEGLLHGITGGRTCFSFGAITYIADITTPAKRTFRMAIITALIFISSPLGVVLGTNLRESHGFYTTFAVCLVLNVLALVFCFCLLSGKNDVVGNKERSCGVPEVLDTWKTLVRARAGSKRAVLLLMVVVCPLFGACLLGEYSVLYLFVRHKFHWGESESGLYMAFRISVIFFGTLLSVGVLSRVLHVSDAQIGLLATSFQVAAGLGNALAQHPWQLYLYPVLDLMHGSIYTVGHSIVSKAVEPGELGRVNGVIGVVDSLIPLVVMPLYNTVYSLTLRDDPGAFFFLSMLCAAACWTAFLTAILLKRGERTRMHLVVA